MTNAHLGDCANRLPFDLVCRGSLTHGRKHRRRRGCVHVPRANLGSALDPCGNTRLSKPLRHIYWGRYIDRYWR
jgi:hypothetical protein